LSSKNASLSPHLVADGVILGISVLGGISFSLVKGALEATSPANLMFLRFSVACLILVPFAWAKRSSGSGDVFLRGAMIGLILFGGFIAHTFGLVYTSASRSGFITSFCVVLVPMLSIILLKKMPGWLAIAGAGLAFWGLYLFTSFDKIQGLAFNLGDALILVSAFLWAGHMIAVGHYAPRLDIFWLVFMQMAVTAIGSLVWSMVSREMVFDLPVGAYGAILFLAIGGTVVITLGQVWAQARTTPTRTAIIWSMEPVFASFFAWFWLGERMGSWGVIGAAFILSGILLAELKPKR